MSNLLGFTLLLVLTLTKGYTVWELWSAEHLDDMILSDAYKRDVSARSPAIIALYETQCKEKLYKEIGFSDRGLPNNMHLITAAFDRKSAKNVWYEWVPEIMDLFVRYNITTDDSIPESEWCPTILFQPSNWSLPVIKYDYSNTDKQLTFKNWAYSHLQIPQIEFTNGMSDKEVNVVLRSKDEHDPSMINEVMILSHLQPSQSTIITENEIGFQMYANGLTMVAVDNEDNIINRYILNTHDTHIVITPSENDKVSQSDMDKYSQYVDRELKLMGSRDWSTRRRYLNNIRTPPHMPSFTDTGFEYMDMPKEICDYLVAFHAERSGENSKIKKRTEGFPKDGTQINTREVPTYMIHIPPEKKMWIGELLQPMMEEWSGSKLKYSTIYGMREYIKGAVLKTHVDRVETHIISVILHVYHEPADVAWPIEVVSWDGRRYHIADEPCMMTFYESSKLIHGRPSTYNGSSWVNAFLHYRPADWKGYKFTSDNRLVTPEVNIPLVDWVYG